MNKTKIIVVEDNIVYCEYVCNMLSREGYRNMKAYHLSTAKKHLQQATDNDIVVADLRLPDGSGIDLLCWMRKEGKMQPFIIMTDYAEVNTAVESMKLGSIDYIPKQLVEDKLVPLIRSILKERQAGQRRMPIFAREGSAFQKIMHRIRLVAATDMSVMIFGENGTGKEHIAHLLHDKSKRAGKPFVAVDCGSLSKELAPSAFFGHVKGAFTGADNAKKGYFHEAEGGTLFLDEVGNLALETQQMLLRAIQERRYRPVGDKADRNFNVRIIAEFLLLVFADSVLTCLRLFLCREFHNVVHNHLAVHRFAHLYLVFLIVVDGLPEYLSVRETVATAFLHIVQNVGHALVHVLGRVAVLLCK